MVVVTYRDDDVGSGHPLRWAIGDLATARWVRRLELPAPTREAVATLARPQGIDPTVSTGSPAATRSSSPMCSAPPAGRCRRPSATPCSPAPAGSRRWPAARSTPPRSCPTASSRRRRPRRPPGGGRPLRHGPALRRRAGGPAAGRAAGAVRRRVRVHRPGDRGARVRRRGGGRAGGRAGGAGARRRLHPPGLHADARPGDPGRDRSGRARHRARRTLRPARAALPGAQRGRFRPVVLGPRPGAAHPGTEPRGRRGARVRPAGGHRHDQPRLGRRGDPALRPGRPVAARRHRVVRRT
jgi:hypothetical protein